MQISEFAAMTGLSADTLRYYEKLGLLHPARDAGGRRSYSEADLRWAAFVRRLKRLGMPLSQIRVYADLRSAGDSTLAQRQEMLYAFRRQLQARMQDVACQMQYLDEKIRWYAGALAGSSPACMLEETETTETESRTKRMSTSMLSGFERFDIKQEPPKMTVSKDTVVFDKQVAEQLGNPQRVFFLVDDNLKRVAIQGCDPDDPQGIDFWDVNDESREKIRWHHKVLIQKLAQMGQLDLSTNTYELAGYLLSQENAMFFDLNTAQAHKRK